MLSDGLNLQVLGFFDGTIDQLHLEKQPSAYKIGKKVKARILYDFSSSPPKFALALADHVVKLGPRLVAEKTEGVQQLYPIGTVVEAVKVLRTEAERGLMVELAPGVEGFVHVRTGPFLLETEFIFFSPDISYLGRSRSISVEFWSMETRFNTPCSCHWIFCVRWYLATLVKTFCHSAKIPASERCCSG